MLEIFHRVVVQAILLYVSETWVLSEAIERKAEWIYTEFLRQIMGKQERRLRHGMWDTPGEEGVREVELMQSASTYIGRQQTTVAQWVALRRLFEVCARETW